MDTHTFDGVYKPEMVVEKKVCKKKKRKGQNVNHHRIDILNLEHVDILVYDFQLKNKGTLRSKTTNIIKILFAQEIVASWEFSKPRCRLRRNMSYEILGIHEDSSDALIESREEYRLSTSSSNHASKENVVFDGVLKSTC